MAERTLTLAIDTAADVAGVALTEGGALLGEATWRARMAHSRQLLPTLDWLLKRYERTKDDIGGVCVCLGPGSYAGLRVGLSTAKALAYGLDAPIAGVGRLEADAYPIVGATASRVVALQAAGRAELAYAAYEAVDDGMRELLAPGLGRFEVVLDAIEAGDVVVGDLATFSAELIEALRAKGARVIEAAPSRVVAIATLGGRRLASGAVDNSDSLVPLYLRPPAIGPQSTAVTR